MASLAAGLSTLLRALNHRRGPLVRMPAFNLGVILVLLALNGALWLFWSATGTATPPLAPPRNVQLTTAAWNAFNAGDYDTAIERARECIAAYGTEAEQDQTRIAAEPLPPTGSVPTDEKDRIIARGVLNDVGTSHFIVGQALERSGRIQEARLAYQKAATFRHARTWDAHGWFFSPADAATARLAALAEP